MTLWNYYGTCGVEIGVAFGLLFLKCRFTDWYHNFEMAKFVLITDILIKAKGIRFGCSWGSRLGRPLRERPFFLRDLTFDPNT